MPELKKFLSVLESIIQQSEVYSSWELAERLFNMPRSVSGKANRVTLEILSEFTDGELVLKHFSEDEYFSWTRPKYWSFERARIITTGGEVICDTRDNLLHVVAHSSPIDKVLPVSDVLKRLHWKGGSADIPYRTSYYDDSWGFCVSEEQYLRISELSEVRVLIEAELSDSPTPYGEAYFGAPGCRDEVLITSYICHPSMANNELSGMLLVAQLIRMCRFLADEGALPISVRFLLAPETFGSIAYICENLSSLKENVRGVLVCSCVGDGRAISTVSGRLLGDFEKSVRVAAKAKARQYDLPYRQYDFAKRGSDERQFASPHVALDVITLCNTKFGEFPEYHTSADGLSVISADAIKMSAECAISALGLFAYNECPIIRDPCEPMLSKVGLYPHTRDYEQTQEYVMRLLNFCAYADGATSLVDMADQFSWAPEQALRVLYDFKSVGYLRE